MQMKKLSLLYAVVFAFLGVFIGVFDSHASTLSLRDYLSEVQNHSPAIESSTLSVDGSVMAAKESDLPFMPKFTANASHQIDDRVATSPFGASDNRIDNLTLGLEKQFDWGLNAKLSYGLVNNDSLGFPPQLAGFIQGGEYKFSQGQTELDLTQPLWRNFLGKETRATETQTQSQSLTTYYSERYKLKQLLAQAEITFYRLAIARESVKLANEIVDRAKKILDWNTKRVRNQLTDKIDMLQSRAAYQSHNLDLQTSLDDVRSAQLAFNELRNSLSNEVPEKLVKVSVDQVLALTPPTRAETTDDVNAAEQSERNAVATNELSLQKAQPDLSLYGSLAYNGVNTYLSPAVADSFTTKHPMYLIGVKFSMPLYFWETSEIRSGRVKEQLGAEAATREKRLEDDQNWVDLGKKLIETKARLKLADDLVQAQKEKMNYEQYRLKLGRTTTYQVLTFEQDYATSIIARLQIEQQVVNLHSQMKPFE